jgi:quinoprotein glucose dehydrogenase
MPRPNTRLSLMLRERSNVSGSWKTRGSRFALGNYGWNIREALHPFPPNSQSSTQDMIDPIWEYHHTVGKSITGGTVYRGKKLPGLKGYYIYADYVTGLVWGLKYDDKSKAVTANRLIQHNKLPIMSFGEDADGELYLTTTFGALYTIGPAE